MGASSAGPSVPELKDRLQTALGGGYRVEKELGGGGMSRVFLAEETRLGRRVVVKVLPPEMAAGVSVDRFEREIQLAAKLQHPHIVPLLTAGSSDDLLFYIMPFIEGESLRAKLAREGELPVAEALRILRDVLDALAYAHGQHVVHRDIKPDNVLLSGKHALVTDFGVAKAVAESTGRNTITSMGVALGTPLYMAPEQAAADPHVDHRADLYAVGAMAYEMLCGRPPFAGVTPQAVLAAHLTDAPEPVTRHRTAVPDALNALIMRCLEKKPADRWQRAEELLPHIEAMLTPTGGTTPAGTQPVISSGTQAAIDRAHPVRVTALFGLASAGVLAIVYALVQLIGLPDWVYYGAMVLLAAGWPVLLMTGHHERQRALARSSGRVNLPSPGMRRWLTWRSAVMGGGLAFAGLGVVTTVYMAMRTLGIGPVGTLVATGVLKERDRLVLADFENRTGDSTLGATVTELFRVGLAQSPVITVLEPTKVGEVLSRMQRQPGTRVDVPLGREIAQREGLKGVVAGSIVSVGSGYALTAQVLSTDGRELTVQQEAAGDVNGLIAAVGRLSGKLRERIGESLRHIRAERLEQVTTSSFRALQLYTQAIHTYMAGDDGRAVAMLEEAVRLDTAFAMAYRTLGAYLGNQFQRRARVVEVITKAYEHRDRLTERERYHAIAFYHESVTGQLEQAIGAYQTLLDRYSDDSKALNNLGVAYELLVDAANAERYYRRALEQDSSSTIAFGNVIDAQVLGGKLDDAEATLARFAAKFPGNPRVAGQRVNLAVTRGQYDAAERELRALRDAQRGNLRWRSTTGDGLAMLAALRGRVGEAERYWADALAAEEQRGLPGSYVFLTANAALAIALVKGDPAGALRLMDAALRRHPLDSLHPLDRPFVNLAWFYAFAGRPDRARSLLAQFDQAGVARLDPAAARQEQLVRAVVALAEQKPRDAMESLRRFGQHLCLQCWLSPWARAYDMAGEIDSAIVYYERYVNAPWGYRLFMDYLELPAAHQRLGELYEQRGNRQQALEHYRKFVDLWSDSDPGLQPQVREVKQRMASLAGEGGPR